MSFYNKIPSGLADLKTWVTDSISTAKTTIEQWCNNRFSLNTHDHDAKYDSKGSSSAVQTNLDAHAGSTIKHITDTERNKWNNKANGSHEHPQSDVTGLVAALAGKADSDHTHSNFCTLTSGSDTDTQGRVSYILINSSIIMMMYYNTTSSNTKNISLLKPDNFYIDTVLNVSFSGTASYNRKGRAQANISNGACTLTMQSGESSTFSTNESVLVIATGHII